MRAISLSATVGYRLISEALQSLTVIESIEKVAETVLGRQIERLCRKTICAETGLHVIETTGEETCMTDP